MKFFLLLIDQYTCIPTVTAAAASLKEQGAYTGRFQCYFSCIPSLTLSEATEQKIIRLGRCSTARLSSESQQRGK